MKSVLTVLAFLCCSLAVFGQSSKPKLVVGVVVDQMRQEYLWRFEENFGERGFKRLLKEGFQLKNAHYNYVPTYTGPGHTSVYTGTTPKYHGIISNNWYSRELGRMVYCAEDTTANAVGGSEKNGNISPVNNKTSTITDELKLSTQGAAKVIAFAIKDRGAALPAGHMPDGAYWYDSETGNFMTSDFYMDELPQWLQDFNASKKADAYLNGMWDFAIEEEKYTHSYADNNPYEGPFRGQRLPTFPYNLKELRKENGNYGLLADTPFGNTITTDVSLAALKAEQMGKDDVTDFLAISYSSTDYVGHRFGPHSKEIEDIYIRLDREIERLLTTLDAEVGQGNYTVFLTADHAVADVPNFLIDKNMGGGNFQFKRHKSDIEAKLSARFGAGEWIENYSSDQIFLNRSLIAERNIELYTIQQFAADLLLQLEGIAETYTGIDMLREEYSKDLKRKMQLGYNTKRSGDVLVVYEPNWIPSSYPTGTTHHSGYTYDTHVPILFFGHGIPQGESVRPYEVTDIAPTLSMLLEIKLPSSSIGTPVLEIFESKED